MIAVTQGEFVVTADADVVLSAILGSCVSLCLHDPVAHVGGMTHTLHIDGRHGLAGPLNDFEQVFNGMVKLGAARDRLTVAVVGGAHVIGGTRAVGTELVRSVLTILSREALVPSSMDIRGSHPRRLRFTPSTGALDVTVLADAKIDDRPTAKRRAVPKPVELF